MSWLLDCPMSEFYLYFGSVQIKYSQYTARVNLPALIFVLQQQKNIGMPQSVSADNLI